MKHFLVILSFILYSIPSFAKSTITLSPQECEQVAGIVTYYALAVRGVKLTPEIKMELDKSTEHAKIVAKKIIEDNVDYIHNPENKPEEMFVANVQACFAAKGQTNLAIDEI